MPKVPRQSKIEGIERTASTLKTRNMPLSVFSSFDLNLTMTHTNGTDGASNTVMGLLQSITKFELILDGQDNIVSVPFYFLYYMNYYDNSKAPFSSIHTTNSTEDDSVVHVTLPHKFVRGIVPDDGLLDARLLSSNVAQANWGAITIEDASAVSAGSLEIDSNEYTNVEDPAQLRRKLARHEYAFEEVALTKAGEISIDVPTKGTNQYYRMWLFCFTSAGVLANTLIDNFKLQTRSFVYIDKSASRIQRRNQEDYSITFVDGIYVIDLTTLGRLSERLDARKLPELTMKVNSLLTTGTMTIVYEKSIFAPVRQNG